MVDQENNPPTIKTYPLERRKILKKFVASEIGLLVVVIIIVGILLFFGGASGWGSNAFYAAGAMAGLFILHSAVNWWYQTKYYEVYYYDIRKNFLVIRKGVFMPRETVLPYEKLQDVYMDQDIWDRVFNLWDLHVSTATIMSGMEAHIDGVNKLNAETMRELLLKKIKDEK